MSRQEIVPPLLFFRFMANLEQSGSRISDIVTFYLTKTENRTKQSLTQLSHYCFELSSAANKYSSAGHYEQRNQ